MHAHDRDCPACGAPAGYYCNRPNGTALKTPHKARSARNNPSEAVVREERRRVLEARATTRAAEWDAARNAA
jgi:hypothetical protein